METGKTIVGKLNGMKQARELYTESISRLEKFVLLALLTLGLESVIYFTHWWFWGGHRKQTAFFVILSFAIFWEIFRNLINWYIYSFVKTPEPQKTHARFYC